MGTLDTVVSARNSAYDKIWDIAQGALNDLAASSRNSSAPTYYGSAELHFDPGIPAQIKFLAGTVDPSSIITKIDGYIGNLSNIQPPVFPDAPSFTMEDHQLWNDTFADKIKTSLSDYVTSMGVPDVAYQNAIFNEEYERNLQTLNDLYDLADAKTGAKGFSYTNDYGNGLKIDAQVKYQFDKTQVSRNISKLITEWARQNYQHATQQGIELEKAHMDFTYKYCTAFVNIYKEMVQTLLERYKAQVELVLAPITALEKELSLSYEYSKINAEIDKTNETLKQSRSELQIKEALQKYGSDTQRIVSEFSGQLEQIRASAQHSAGLAQSTSSSVIGLVKQ